MKRSRYKGFTVLELLIVVAIIGLLSAAVMGALASSRAKSRDAARIKTIVELRNALELYYATNNRYPTGDETVIDDNPGPLIPTYLSRFPPPIQGQTYQYQSLNASNLTTCASGVCRAFHLAVKLEQGANTGVFRTDADLPSGSSIDGLSVSTNCASSSATPTTDLCYDIMGR